MAGGMQANFMQAKSKAEASLNGTRFFLYFARTEKKHQIRPDGRKYDGEWRDGKQHGRGVFITAAGKKREAEWGEGKRLRWVHGGNSESITTSTMGPLSSPRDIQDVI